MDSVRRSPLSAPHTISELLERHAFSLLFIASTCLLATAFAPQFWAIMIVLLMMATNVLQLAITQRRFRRTALRLCVVDTADQTQQG